MATQEGRILNLIQVSVVGVVVAGLGSAHQRSKDISLRLGDCCVGDLSQSEGQGRQENVEAQRGAGLSYAAQRMKNTR